MLSGPNENTDGKRMTKTLVPLSLIAEGLEPNGADVFIGGVAAASDIGLLRRHGITTIVNCAVNADVNYVALPDEGSVEGEVNVLCRSGIAPFRVYKLGLVDGDNPRGMMLGGYCILHGAFRQVMPERESYARQEQGNVLVHCREGRSRSVAMVALYLHLQDPGRFPGLEDAIALVREKRGLPREEWYETPKPEMIAAAAEAARGIRSLRDLGMLPARD